MSDIKEIVQDFVDGQIAINYLEASEDQMLAFEELFNGLTDARPHDHMSYSQHMMHFAPDRYCLLTCDGKTVASYIEGANCRPKVVSLEDVLKAAGINVKTEEISEADFDSLF